MNTLHKNFANAKTNSVNEFESAVDKKKSQETWRKSLFNEWIFSLTVFLILSLIIIEKIYFNYVLSMVINNANNLYNKVDVYSKADSYNKAERYNKSDLYNTTDVFNTIDVNNKADVNISSYFFTLTNIVNVKKLNELVLQILIPIVKLVNTIYQALYDALLNITGDHHHLIMIFGIILGVITTFGSWFIIYMDSRIPGNDPAFPFLLQKYRITITVPINLNYCVAALIGLLTTISYLHGNGYFDS